jgi:hypothetical protein
MKLIRHFDTLLTDIVNLNDSRIELLEQRVVTISKFLKGSDYVPYIRRFAPQAHGCTKQLSNHRTTRTSMLTLLCS